MPHLLIFTAIISLQVEGYTVVDIEVHHGIILDLRLLLSFHALDPLRRREREGKFDLHYRLPLGLSDKKPTTPKTRAMIGIAGKSRIVPMPHKNAVWLLVSMLTLRTYSYCHHSHNQLAR